MTGNNTDQPPPPELHKPPPPVTENEKNGYKPAKQEISSDNLDLVENFIGSIYGEAKRIDQANIGENQFTKGVKLDAHKEIVNLRKEVSSATNPSVQQPVHQPPQLQPHQPVHQPPQMQQNTLPVSPSDSLILKHEIDQLKEQIKDIKRVYDEFVKLKTLKGKWVVSSTEKSQSAPTISKTWNIITKLLKNKTKSITIEYVEDE